MEAERNRQVPVTRQVSPELAAAYDALRQAVQAVIENLAAIGGAGGFVAVDRSGALELPFNTAGMYRGYVKHDGIMYTAVYDEPYRSA